MRMKTFLRFVSPMKKLHGIHQQKNVKNVRLVCQIIKVRSVSFPLSGPVFVSTVILYSFTYDAVNIIDDGNLMIA